MKSLVTLMKLTLAAIRPVKRVSVTAWADRYRQLPAESAEPGRWRTSRTPYLSEIMNAFTANEIHRVVVKCCAQVGKSECLLNVAARFIHLDPCTLMIIQPTLEMAQDFSRSRLTKMIQDSKILTPLFYTKTETILSKYFRGGRLILAGANSPAGLASRPVRILLCDEVDRFPASASSEGDPVELAAKRTTTYWNYKIGLFSTPTTEGASRIEIEYLSGTQEEWQYECPGCGEYHALDYRQMKADYTRKADSKSNYSYIVKSVKWQCPDCGYEFDEITMKHARQKYVAKNPEALINGVRSFWLNGFSSPWLSWKMIMREYLESKGDPVREKVFFNTRLGLTYALRGEYDNEDEFMQRREEYPAELPQGVKFLTAGVDVQSNRLEYEIAGWGNNYERWGILRGIVRGAPNQITTWQELDAVLDREYKFANGDKLKVVRTFIDSGYATKAVYEYCQKAMRKGRFAIKGLGTIGIPLLYKYTYPKIPGARIVLTILGVNDGKQEVMSALNIEEAGAHYMHFPLNAECGYDSVYFKQLISEHRVMKKHGGIINVVWEPVRAKIRNESLDLAVYSLAAAKSLKPDWERLTEAEKPTTPSRKIKNQVMDIWR